MLKFKWETEFKQTEIGEIPKEWDIKQLGGVLKIKYGKGLPERDRKNGNIPVFGSSGIVGYHNSPLSKGPGIIIGRKGDIGSVYLSKRDFFPIDTVFYSEDVKNADFLYYVLNKTLTPPVLRHRYAEFLNEGANFLRNFGCSLLVPNNNLVYF